MSVCAEATWPVEVGRPGFIALGRGRPQTKDSTCQCALTPTFRVDLKQKCQYMSVRFWEVMWLLEVEQPGLTSAWKRPTFWSSRNVSACPWKRPPSGQAEMSVHVLARCGLWKLDDWGSPVLGRGLRLYMSVPAVEGTSALKLDDHCS